MAGESGPDQEISFIRLSAKVDKPCGLDKDRHGSRNAKLHLVGQPELILAVIHEMNRGRPPAVQLSSYAMCSLTHVLIVTEHYGAWHSCNDKTDNGTRPSARIGLRHCCSGVLA